MHANGRIFRQCNNETRVANAFDLWRPCSSGLHTLIPNPARATDAIEKAKAAISGEQKRKRVAFALGHPGGSKGKEASSRLLALPAFSLVFVYRTKTKRWEGPSRLISVDGVTSTVQLHRGRRIFRSTCVKSVVSSILDDDWRATRGV